MGTRLVLRLAGDSARLGETDAVEVARLILGANTVVSRTASVLAGRPPGAKGSLPRSIAEATRLRLRGITDGSLVLDLELPGVSDEPEALGLDDLALGEAAALTALAVLEGSETGFGATEEAWSHLASDLDIGGRNDSLTCTLSSRSRPPAVLDRAARTRLAIATKRPRRRDEEGERIGILYEADFEKNSAHLRTQDGVAVTVRFDEHHADAIKDALRERTRVRGQITYNERTSEVVAVDLVQTIRADQLVLGVPVTDFWRTPTVAELAAAQGAKPIEDIAELEDNTITDEEAEAFLDALGL